MVNAAIRPRQFINPIDFDCFLFYSRVGLWRPVENKVVSSWFWTLILGGFRLHIITEPSPCSPRLARTRLLLLFHRFFTGLVPRKSIVLSGYWCVAPHIWVFLCFLYDWLAVFPVLLNPELMVLLVGPDLLLDGPGIVVSGPRCSFREILFILIKVSLFRNIPFLTLLIQLRLHLFQLCFWSWELIVSRSRRLPIFLFGLYEIEIGVFLERGIDLWGSVRASRPHTDLFIVLGTWDPLSDFQLVV